MCVMTEGETVWKDREWREIIGGGERETPSGRAREVSKRQRERESGPERKGKENHREDEGKREGRDREKERERERERVGVFGYSVPACRLM